MEYENMRLPELKSRDHRLKNYSRIRKAELVALLQNNGRAPASRTRSPPPPPQRCAAYVTLKYDNNGLCRIHSISDGDIEIVTNERCVVLPWKMVTRHGKNMGLHTAK